MKSTAPILLIQAANASDAKLTDYFNNTNQPWVGVSRLSDAAAAKQQRSFGMVVCDWELFQACRNDSVESECCHSLLSDAAPMIFVSANQTVSVNFRPVMGRSFYSLKAAESSGLFEIIAELATKIPTSESHLPHPVDPWAAQEVDSLKPRRYLPAPNFSLGQTITPAMTNSSVHSLY